MLLHLKKFPSELSAKGAKRGVRHLQIPDWSPPDDSRPGRPKAGQGLVMMMIVMMMTMIMMVLCHGIVIMNNDFYSPVLRIQLSIFPDQCRGSLVRRGEGVGFGFLLLGFGQQLSVLYFINLLMHSHGGALLVSYCPSPL